MKIEDFEKVTEELELQKEENDKLILEHDEKFRMSKVNCLEYKGGVTLFFSMLAYTALLLTSLGLREALGANFIVNIFPGITYPVALIGGSIGLGVLGRVLFDKKFDIKGRLKSFSTAKTQAEKLEEEVHYQIELEKSNNRNKAIDETIKVLNSNQAMLSRIAARYDLSDKNAPQSIDDAKTKVQELSLIIKEQYDKLDILTTQKVLHDRFWRVRQKFERRSITMMASMVSGLFAMAFGSFPTMVIKDALSSGSILTTLAAPFIPFVVGVVGGSAYMLKRNSDYKKVFNNLNLQLGENALEENLDKKFENAFEERKEIETLIEKQIRDISLAEVQLQESKRYIYAHITEEEKKDVLFKNFPPLKITEETRKDVLEHPERYTGCDIRVRMGKFYTDEEYKQYSDEVLSKPLPGEEKGPILVKKMKPNNKN